MKNWIKKLIPAYFEVRSLFWVQCGNEMNSRLMQIFRCIDDDNYELAEIMIRNFESDFTQSGVPDWIAEQYADIYRAKSMLSFLKQDQ